MSASRIDGYRKRAEECETRAALAKDPEVKGAFLDAARQWRELAHQVERAFGWMSAPPTPSK
jgi:hypothetical protein